MRNVTAEAPVVGRYHDGQPMRSGNAIHVANPTERRFYRNSFLLRFGCVGCTYVLVYARSLEDALEEAASFLRETPMGAGHVQPLGSTAEDLGLAPEDDPWDCDSLTYTESGWLDSDEWAIVAENPDAQLLRKIHRG